MSERSFLRHFRGQLGMAPAEWLRRERVAAAQQLLETTPRHLEQVAAQVGFGSAAAMRAAFRDLVGAPPSRHRRWFGQAR